MIELAGAISQPLVERPPYRWWVLANVVLVYILIPGIACRKTTASPCSSTGQRRFATARASLRDIS
jgi:hypothetical protein